MKLSFLLLFLALSAPSVQAAIEWAGSFALNDAMHTWIMQQVGGAYADPSMKLVVYATDSPDAAAIEASESDATTLIAGTCTDVAEGGSFGPFTTTGACYNLVVDETKATSTFSMDTSGITGMVVYAQHVPTEFENDMHYLQDSAGTDIEPTAQESAGGDHDHDHDHDGGGEEGGETCGCIMEEYGFTMNCEDGDAMTAALANVQSNDCNTDCSSEVCRENYFYMQAHHDYCFENQVPPAVEEGLHDFEDACEDCQISRQNNPDFPACPDISCKVDGEGNAAYQELLLNGCIADCSSQVCIDNFRILTAVHDTCPEDSLNQEAEEGLHDLEVPCAAQGCNAIPDDGMQLVCVKPGDSAAADVDVNKAFVTLGAIAGIVGVL